MCTQCSKRYLEISPEKFSGRKYQFLKQEKNLASVVVQFFCLFLETLQLLRTKSYKESDVFVFDCIGAPGVSKTSDFSSDW
jgi:hypothetical protein